MLMAEEVSGLAECIKTRFSGATVHRFEEPAAPAAGEFSVTLKQEIRKSDSLSQTSVERQYALVYYANLAEAAVVALETLSRYLMNEKEAASAEAGWLRIDSITIAAAEKLENGLHKCSGTLQTMSREPVAFKPHDKINRMEVRMTNN